MATSIDYLKFKVTAEGLENLSKLSDAAENAKGKIEGLGSAILGVSFGAFIMGALDAADRISDLSDATGIAIVNIKSFETALETAGGKAKNVERAINGFVASIEAAADGSIKAREAFNKVGVSLEDIRDLSEQDLLDKTIRGLGRMKEEGKSASEIAATSTILLTKAFRGVDVEKFVEDFQKGKITMAEMAEQIKAAADANAKLEATFRTLQQGALNAIQPILKLFGETELTVKSATKIVQGLGIALGVVFGVSMLANIVAIIGAIARLNVALGVTAGLSNAIGKSPVGLLAKIGAVGVAAGTAASTEIEDLIKKNEDLQKSFGDFDFGVEPGKTKKEKADRPIAVDANQQAAIESNKRIAQSIGEANKSALLAQENDRLAAAARTSNVLISMEEKTANEIKKININADQEIAKATANIRATDKIGPAQKDREIAAKTAEIQKKAALEISDVNLKSATYNQEQNRALEQFNQSQKQTLDDYQERNRLVSQNIDFETTLIGKTADQVEVQRVREGILKSQAQALRSLESQISKLELDKALGIDPKADDKIKEIRKTMKGIQDDTAKAADQAQRFTEAQQGTRLVEADRLNQIKLAVDYYDQQAKAAGTLGDVLRGINANKVDLDFQASLKGLDPLQRQIATINETARKAALAAGRAFAAAFEENGDGLTPERAAQLAAGLKEITKAQQDLANDQVAMLLRSRTFSEGWSQAFKTYSDNAKNASQQAANYFSTFTKGVEDAIVRFVRTGKLSFKDLANSLIEQLVRVQVQQAIAASTSAVGGFGGFGGLLSAGASLLFGGTPFSGGGLIPGFANGGSVGANRPIVVGERGPELFIPQSAGNIIPNNAISSGGNGLGTTIVNYNISAVDASSFRSLVARDPSFIYAVTEQGRRSQPSRRLTA
jgi:lambda family phage tail tape measure protein